MCFGLVRALLIVPPSLTSTELGEIEWLVPLHNCVLVLLTETNRSGTLWEAIFETYACANEPYERRSTAISGRHMLMAN
eukprot:1391590-Amphidinium_carterae.1